jgi:hypothetical protein
VLAARPGPRRLWPRDEENPVSPAPAAPCRNDSKVAAVARRRPALRVRGVGQVRPARRSVADMALPVEHQGPQSGNPDASRKAVAVAAAQRRGGADASAWSAARVLHGLRGCADSTARLGVGERCAPSSSMLPNSTNCLGRSGCTPAPVYGSAHRGTYVPAAPWPTSMTRVKPKVLDAIVLTGQTTVAPRSKSGTV